MLFKNLSAKIHPLKILSIKETTIVCWNTQRVVRKFGAATELTKRSVYLAGADLIKLDSDATRAS